MLCPAPQLLGQMLISWRGIPPPSRRGVRRQGGAPPGAPDGRGLLRIIKLFARAAGIAFWAGLLGAGLAGGALAAIYHKALGELPDVNRLKDVSFETPMQVYTSDNKLIGEFGEHKRAPTPLETIPLRLQQAFLAIEDARFYEHSGIDPIGIMRAAAVAISSAEASQGASTITQQVARNFFLSREKTIQRKLKEIFISWRIEQVLTKDEILELYLNKIALGHRAYGVKAAAQVYYGKELKDLDLAEMATLAGLPKAPSVLNPISHPERSRERRHLVLQRMLTLGFISREEFERADKAPYKTYYHQSAVDLNAPYVAEEARQFALELLGEDAYTQGIQIYTTVSYQNQSLAQRAVFDGVMAYDRRHGFRGVEANIKDNPDFQNTLEYFMGVLQRKNNFEYLKPAIVIKVDDAQKLIEVLTHSGDVLTMPWSTMAHLREYVSDSRQGPPPKIPSRLFRTYDLIYIYRNEAGELFAGQVPEVEAALVAINPRSGAIQAMVGGFDFAKSKFNRTTQSLRQTGSNFKPFLYSAAIAKNIAVNSAYQDLPIKSWDPGSRSWWQPKNSPNRYEGIMTLREALAKSKNAVTIRLIRKVGVPNLVTHVRKFGIEIPDFQQTEAVALGSVEVTPLKLVTAYSVFANGGFLVTPYLIERICRDGEVIYSNPTHPLTGEEPDEVVNAIELEYKDDYDPPENGPVQVLSRGHAFIMADLLRTNVYGGRGIHGGFYGTGSRAKTLTGRNDLHAKTGTTNKVHDAWFSGFNRYVAATAWIGFDNDRNLGYSLSQGPEGGAYSALPIFAQYIRTSQADNPQTEIERPSDVFTRTSNGISDFVLSSSTVVNDASADEFPGPEDGSMGNTGLDTSDITEHTIF